VKKTLAMLSLILHLLALVQFHTSPAPESIYEGFLWQFHLLLVLSFAASLLLYRYSRNPLALLLFRLLAVLLIAYPTGHYIWIGTLLMMGLAADTALYLPLPWGRILSLAILIPLVLFQRSRSAFHLPVDRTLIPDLLLLIFLPLLAGQTACFLKQQRLKEEEQKELNRRLDLAASRLIEANLGYQNYSAQLEARTLDEERRRISRDIHDSVGYALTNVRVMLEAGAIQIDRKPEEAKDLILRAMEETRLCLEETRASMRELRGQVQPDYRGLTAINRLVKAFESSTGIEVTMEFGEAPSLFPPEIDKIVYRTIQEAMTNSFRHGMASRIDIMFWLGDGTMQVLIRDNGKGSPSVKEGLGLAGMRERVRSIGGAVEYGNGTGGFQVRAFIPLPGKGERNDEEQ
jgi:signal transduction histidine kinase